MIYAAHEKILKNFGRISEGLSKREAVPRAIQALS